MLAKNPYGNVTKRVLHVLYRLVLASTRVEKNRRYASLVVTVIMAILVTMVIRTDRTTRTPGTNKTDRTDKSGQTDLTFKLDFPGNLCRAAFAILAMFPIETYARTLV